MTDINPETDFLIDNDGYTESDMLALKTLSNALRNTKIALSLCLMIGVIASSGETSEEVAHPAGKRIAVLYFENHTQFDSSTGCGCVPGFIAKIFGTKKRKEVVYTDKRTEFIRTEVIYEPWDLETGFVTMLNRKLAETNVYQPVSWDELLDAMAQMTLSRDRLKKMDTAQRAKFARLLNADVLVTGDIRRFNQERLRANASRTLQEGGRQAGQGTASFMTGIQVMGYLHRATVKLDMRCYDAHGEPIKFRDKAEDIMVTELPIVASRDHSLAGTRAAALEASVTEQGTNLSFGQTRATEQKNPNPIVGPIELNKIKFASQEYDKTLLGMVTNEALTQVVIALRDDVGPNFITPWETRPATAEAETKPAETASAGSISGKIQYVDEALGYIYVNIGSARGIAINQHFAVYSRGKPIRDIDTGEILTYARRKVAIIAVANILNDKVSICRLVEGTDTLKIGDVVQEMPSEEEEAAPPESQ